MSALTPGCALAHYRIEQKLGAGGMGEVWRARDLKLDRPVAIKVLPDWASQDPDATRRFLEEARLASILSHPNIVTIHSIDEVEGTHFIVMEYVEGETLRARAQRAPLPAEELADIGAQVAEALAAAHAVGLVHRDIKSANIIVTPQGQAKVLDFGIAKRVPDAARPAGEQTTMVQHTALGLIVGTPSYMSPEQARGEPLDGRTDIFSLGVVLYEAATGRLPFEGSTSVAILHAIGTVEPAPPSRTRTELPPELDGILARALAKDREERFATARELADALAGLGEVREAVTGPVVVSRQTLTRTPNNLTIPLTSFVGRKRERAEIRRLIAGSRLVTLIGAGGSGKTRLALQVATEVLPEYPDGAWLVELEALMDGGLVAQSVAQATGVREEPGRPILDTLVEALAPKQLLLILDNSEHLAGAVASVVLSLLRACPGLRVLTTSREALGVPGEVVWRTPTLGAPDAHALPGMRLDAIARYEAVRLFADRAAAVHPSFALTEENAATVARVCARLDGIPLAIELAAVRVKVLSPERILDRLQDRFRLLTAGSRTALPRHQTLRATVDWSYELLSDVEKRLLGRLSTFAGGFDLEGAEGICAVGPVQPDDVLDLLTHLVDKSLVTPEERAGGEMRYSLLETIREYGRERLREAGEETELATRHGAYFLALSLRAEPELQAAHQARWFDRLADEEDNLRTAFQGFLERGEAGRALQMGGALWRYWWVRGVWSEGRGLLRSALMKDAAGSLSPARASALYASAVLGRGQGDYVQPLVDLEESLGIFQAQGDKAGVALALFEMGNLANEVEDLGEARRLYGESLALRRELGDRRGISSVLHNLGVVAAAQEDFAEARKLYEEALACHRELGNRAWEAASLNGLGEVAFYMGDFEAARGFQELGLDLQRELGDRRGIAFSLRELGRIATALRDFPAAEARLRESLLILREIGDPSGTADSLEALAVCAAATGRAERALRLAGAASAGRAVTRTALSKPDQEILDRSLATARAALPEEAARTAFEQGRALGPLGAVEEALAEG